MIELILSVMIASVIFIVVVSVINIVITRSKGGFESFQAQDESTGLLNKIAKEIRQTNELVTAGSQSITFRRYLAVADAAPAQVRYFLNGQTLTRGQILPTGTPPNYTYDPLTETTEIESLSIVNGGAAIFTYFDENGAQLAAPITAGEVTLVGVSLSFEQEGNLSPLQVDTRVQLRFNKSNL